MTGDFRYLQQRRRTWYVRIRVPPKLVKKAGKSNLIQSLKTHSITEARAKRWEVVAELKAHLNALGKGSTKTALQHALEWRLAHMKAAVDVIDPVHEATEKEQVAWVIGDLAKDMEPTHGTHAALRFVKIATSESPILSRMIEPWLVEKATFATGNAVRQNRTAVQAFLDWTSTEDAPTGDHKIDGEALMASEVDRRLAGRYTTFLAEQGKATGTINRHIAHLGSFWEWMIQKGEFEGANPWSKQQLKARKRGDAPSRRAFTQTELKALLSGPASQPIQDLMPLALLSGCRQDELCSLRKEDILEDADGLAISITQGKSQAAIRRIPVHPLIADIVRRRRDAAPEWGYIFGELNSTGPDDKRNGAVSSEFTDYRRSVGVSGEDTVFHSFRSNISGSLIALGVQEDTIALLMGHEQKTLAARAYNRDGLPTPYLRGIIDQLSFGPEIDDVVRKLAAGEIQGTVKKRVTKPKQLKKS
jgi:integrase